jgi:hypothetical protein
VFYIVVGFGFLRTLAYQRAGICRLFHLRLFFLLRTSANVVRFGHRSLHCFQQILGTNPGAVGIAAAHVIEY